MACKRRFPHRFCNGVPLRPHLYSADSLKTACAVEQDRSLMQCASSKTIRYLLRSTLVYKPKDLNRDWSPRFLYAAG